MLIKRLILSMALVTATALAGMAYEYTFNWNELASQLPVLPDPNQQPQESDYFEVDPPTEGINIFIHPSQIPWNAQNPKPYVHAWNGGGYTTTWPGIQPDGDAKLVSVIGNDNQKESFYWYHFDEPEDVNIQVTFDGNQEYKRQFDGLGKGSHFFYYAPYSGLEPKLQYNKTTFYVRVMGSNITPTLYYFDYGGDWNNQHEMTPVTIDGTTWYKYSFPTNEVAHGGVIISDHGNNATQTSDIRNIKAGEYYLEYYPNGDRDRYDNLRHISGNDCNYKLWDNGASSGQEISKEITLTTTGEYGTASITIICQTVNDVYKVKVVNGELQFPLGASVSATVNDGHNLRQIWLGNPTQGAGGYGFENVTNATKQNVRDMEGLWNGSDNDHLYVVNSASNTFALGKQTNGGNEVFYIANGSKVYSEGTTLHGLLSTQYNVREQNHAFDDDLVAVGVRNVAGRNCLVCRSVEPRAAVVTDKPSYTDPNGNIYPWSNPATPQYDWIVLQLDNPEQYVTDPANYVGKVLRNVRGKFCEFTGEDGNNGWTLWLTPFMSVMGTPEVVGEASTTLNTYTMANFVEHDGDDHYMMEPRLAELCNVIDIMRTNDQILQVPTNAAQMPADENNQARDNIYTKLGIDYGYTSLYQNTYYDFWRASDEEVLTKNGLEGQTWRLKDKVYDCQGALVLASQHSAGQGSSYQYPLDYPFLNYMQTNNGCVMHIIGEAELSNYDAEMYVGNSDYWSRFDYANRRNAYRNDVLISIGAPEKTKTLDLTLKRFDATGTTPLADVATVKVSTANNTISINVTSLPASIEAKDDPAIKAIERDQRVFENGYSYNVQNASNNLVISDMFYSESLLTESPESKSGVTYQLVDNNNESHSIVGAVPVFEPKNYDLSRAKYTKAEVDNDTNGELMPDEEFVNANFDVKRAGRVDNWTVMRDNANTFMSGEAQRPLDRSAIGSNGVASLNDNENIATPQQHEYVPVLGTVYNGNTYGTFKQRVTDASTTMAIASNFNVDQLQGGLRVCPIQDTSITYYNAQLDLTSLVEDLEGEKAYLMRVWRVVDGTKTLLNDQTEFTDANVIDFAYKYGGTTIHNSDWATNYVDLAENLFVEAVNQQATPTRMRLVDTFVIDDAQPTTGSGAPRRAAAGGHDISYEATLYVEDRTTHLLYVKKAVVVPEADQIVTAIDDIDQCSAPVASVRYVSATGLVGTEPFDGINIVVTTYTDGTVTTTKQTK